MSDFFTLDGREAAEGGKMRLIVGPCVIEGKQWFVDWAGKLVDTLRSRYPGLKIVLKGSFDKANRTRSGSFRGIGIDDGLEALQEASILTGCVAMTDVHEPWQAYAAADYGVGIQTPAFLGRQTSLLEAAGAAADLAGVPLNVKKPQFMAINDVPPMLSKTAPAAAWWTHRGTLYGPHELLIPAHELGHMASYWGRNGFVDLTHTNRGQIRNTEFLFNAAYGAGIRNFFAEVHPNPPEAKCDAKHQISLPVLLEILDARPV